MKIQPRHFIAAPFLLVSAFLLFNSSPTLIRSWGLGWGHFAFTVIMSAIMVLCPGVLGVLALKRRWEDFVKIIATFAGLALFGLFSQHANKLAQTVDDVCQPDYRTLGALWSLCVVASPVVIIITAYKRLVPLIIRRIYKNAPA